MSNMSNYQRATGDITIYNMDMVIVLIYNIVLITILPYITWNFHGTTDIRWFLWRRGLRNGPHVMGDFWERETRKITVRYNKMTRKAGGFANFIIFYSIFIRIYTHNTTQPTFYDMFVCLKMIRVSQKISNCVFWYPIFRQTRMDN